MRFGVILPGGSAREQLEQALLAEQAGWDGVFVWEAAYGVDAWGLLTAIGVRTSRIRLGTMLTPLPWRRPWKVASQVATLDQLSGGRATLAVGLGATETDLPRTGEELDRRIRAAMLDEGIDLIRELWAGRSQYHGEYYDYSCPHDDLGEVGRPVQERIPIWVVGAWPRPKSMRRVLRCDGVLPQFQPGADTPEEMRVLRTWLSEHGMAPEFDVIAEGETPADDREAAAQQVAPWADAGATWWLETRWEMPHHSPERMQQVRDRIEAGPPR
ncbi:LLM class flavin-dependent oxidoreductase [Kribbella monticola]|uniref:LLM class flavin-dependent oxidoreductase n=1 Tax=Kribbella monticola TaxID=2185285 RepID=UPI000DD32146|nr:LLM class flavin-dependent oxidoreductase [Kribbella monticola]